MAKRTPAKHNTQSRRHRPHECVYKTLRRRLYANTLLFTSFSFLGCRGLVSGRPQNSLSLSHLCLSLRAHWRICLPDCFPLKTLTQARSPILRELCQSAWCDPIAGIPCPTPGCGKQLIIAVASSNAPIGGAGEVRNKTCLVGIVMSHVRCGIAANMHRRTACHGRNPVT